MRAARASTILAGRFVLVVMNEARRAAAICYVPWPDAGAPTAHARDWRVCARMDADGAGRSMDFKRAGAGWAGVALVTPLGTANAKNLQSRTIIIRLSLG